MIAGASTLRAQEAYRTPTEPSPPAEPPSYPSYRSPTELKKLPLEALVDVEIMSASRRPELLSHAASAIDVITGDEIERSGVTNLPDALRLGVGLEVAQISGDSWAISTRGFDIGTANKIQVLMDGRILYTPLFSGVFWDVQQAFLPDLEQIEVIRGPGATLWGANAVNGVINIRSKLAKDTQGWLLYGGGGNEETGFGGIRYGGMIGRDISYRVYVMHQSRDALELPDGSSAGDASDITQGGFRIDARPRPDDLLTLQGDAYAGHFGQLNADDIDVNGQNIIGRWTRQLAPESSLSVQTYFDRTHRQIPGTGEENRDTFDAEAQYSLRAGAHQIVYGGNYRFSSDRITDLGPGLGFIPNHRDVHLVSGYAQDEWHILPDKFSLIGGSKFEYNSFSGFEIQPTGRFLWLPAPSQTVWGAISRAVRTPTQFDQDLIAPNPSTGRPTVLITNRDFDSEELVAYELGYRVKATNQLSFDLAGYYNVYDNLRSLEPQSATGFPLLFQNKLNARSYGGELAVQWRINDWWLVEGNISLRHLRFHHDPDSLDTSNGTIEANDPDASFLIHSAIDLAKDVQFDAYLRYADSLPNPATPSYLELDLRLAWSPVRNLEIAIVGRNLLDDAHAEFSNTNPVLTREVQRSVYGTLKWSF